VPRLIAAGADLRRVHIVSAVLQEGGQGRRTFNLQADLALLERKIAEIGDVALVIIDPISSYMGKADSHKNSEVRGALEPASEMAERVRVAILSITHFSKSGAGGNSKALHRFIGSIAFVGAPRAAFAVIEDAENEGRMLVLHAKNNMAAKPQGLAYRLEQRLVGDPGDCIVASHVVFDSAPVSVSADEALRATADAGKGEGPRRAGGGLLAGLAGWRTCRAERHQGGSRGCRPGVGNRSPRQGPARRGGHPGDRRLRQGCWTVALVHKVLTSPTRCSHY
jgi:putative DNA primase/helicase